MYIPDGMTESQILEIFNKVIAKLCYKFRFGTHHVDDIRQQAMLYAIEGMSRYDDTRPLENFIYVHVRNRLYNFKRNNYFRLSKPCERCPLKAFISPDGCSAYLDRNDCELYSGWINRNTVRKNLTNVLEYNQISIGEKNMGYADQPISTLNSKEILALIDQELPISLRKSYLMQLAGNKIPKKDKLILEETIINLLKSHGYEI